MIICNKCKINKNKEDFSKDKSRPNGFSYICKECKSLWTKNKNPKVKIRKSRIDMTGKIYERLTVIEYSHEENKNHFWLCECSCENKTIKTISGKCLRNGSTKSCGCLIKESNTKNKSTHKLTKSSEYSSWCAMKKRCLNKNTKEYENYGGRGIKVCDRWLNSFENFLEDMGPKPSDNNSIDRINNNGNYCKENCRWATDLEQSNNKRNNILITYNSKTQSIKQWSNESGISYQTIQYRIKNGWSFNDTINTPTKSKDINVENL